MPQQDEQRVTTDDILARGDRLLAESARLLRDVEATLRDAVAVEVICLPDG